MHDQNFTFFIGCSGSRISVLDFNKSTQPFTTAIQVLNKNDLDDICPLKC